MADGLSSFQKDFHHFSALGFESKLMEDYDISGPDCDATGEQVKRISDGYYRRASRGPDDVMISGPLAGFVNNGPGRRFQTRREGWNWAAKKYGFERLVFPRQTVGRWCVIVKGLAKSHAEGLKKQSERGSEANHEAQ